MYIYIYMHMRMYYVYICIHQCATGCQGLVRSGIRYPFYWSLPCRRPEADMDAFRLGAGLRLQNLGCTFCLQQPFGSIWM